MNQVVKKHGVQAVNMTREEAEQFMRCLDEARKQIVLRFGRVRRSRLLSAEEKRKAQGELTDDLAVFVALQERIGGVFNLGGY